MYPARCPGCGSVIVDTLHVDNRVPVYGCGSSPGQLRCVELVETTRRHELGDDGLHNVYQPTADELDELGDVWSAMRPAVIWSGLTPRVGLCAEPGCWSTAVDGWCLEHDRQIAEAVAQARRAELGVADVS